MEVIGNKRFSIIYKFKRDLCFSGEEWVAPNAAVSKQKTNYTILN